jgi:hypothetical protein
MNFKLCNLENFIYLCIAFAGNRTENAESLRHKNENFQLKNIVYHEMYRNFYHGGVFCRIGFRPAVSLQRTGQQHGQSVSFIERQNALYQPGKFHRREG